MNSLTRHLRIEREYKRETKFKCLGLQEILVRNIGRKERITTGRNNKTRGNTRLLPGHVLWFPFHAFSQDISFCVCSCDSRPSLLLPLFLFSASHGHDDLLWWEGWYGYWSIEQSLHLRVESVVCLILSLVSHFFLSYFSLYFMITTLFAGIGV